MRYYKIDLDGAAYTYSWGGQPPLQRGDTVLLPANKFNPKPFYGQVLRELDEPDFDGKISAIIEKADLV